MQAKSVTWKASELYALFYFRNALQINLFFLIILEDNQLGSD